MMAQALVGRTTKAAIVCAAAISAVLLATLGARPAASLIAGALLGLTPIVTWRPLAAALFEGKGVLLAIAVSLAKIILYITALYVLVPRLDVLPLGAGVLLPSAVMAVIAHVRP